MNSENDLPARAHWIAASQFHPISERQLFGEIRDRIRTVKPNGSKPAGGNPLVLLDLDSTLYEVSPRTLRILQEWLQSSESRRFESVRDRLLRLTQDDLGYSLRDTFQAAGLSLDDFDVIDAWESAKNFWSQRFFTNDYLIYDVPYRGAARFANEIHELGAEIVYLTGRDEPGMGEGTRRNLVRDGFPWKNDRTHLLMKPRFDQDDLEHKKSAAEFVQRQGVLVASFENEPVNLVALYELFPQAMHVFVETTCSDRGAKAINGLYRVKSFE